MNLFIVESPGKVKKIQEFLGSDFKVMASMGHVRDLPEKQMGVAPPDFKPQYVPTERGGNTLADLGAAAKKASAVYLATDPDREGEAIAWHLEDALGLNNAKRVTYTEITKSAVLAAIKKARRTDMGLVRSQEGRRVLDRLVGYTISTPVSKAMGTWGLSAGRVQSPALRLVVDREAAIENFRMTTHFGAEVVFDEVEAISQGWKAQWNSKNWLEDGNEYFLDQALAEKVAGLRSFTVKSYVESQTKQAPPAPFTTSSLQQAASNALKLNPKLTMELAQKLYEDGHITYMRTDSPNLSAEAIEAVRSLASKNDWPVPPKPRAWKSKDGSQEAHEAVRPTHFEVEEAGETEGEKALYALIRLRALACQLDDAVYAVTKAVLETDLEGKAITFEATGRRQVQPGWRVVLDGDQTEEVEKEPENPVPELKEGAKLVAASGKLVTKKTRPPARFTEAALVRELERRGIGRPSTYAAIIDQIGRRGYVKLEKRQLLPTPLGQKMIGVMSGHFSFLDYDFTKNMEERLDGIASGQADYVATLGESYDLLTEELEKFLNATSPKCPDCGKRLAHKFRQETEEKKGFDFWGCTGYPECEATFKNNEGRPGNRLAKTAVLSEFKCPDCGKPLIHRVKEGEGGYDFWGCSGFKDESCKSSFKNDDGKPGQKNERKTGPPPSEHKCPKCKKPLYRRQGTSRKTGKDYDFYSCADRACDSIYYPKKDGSPNF